MHPLERTWLAKKDRDAWSKGPPSMPLDAAAIALSVGALLAGFAAGNMLGLLAIPIFGARKVVALTAGNAARRFEGDPISDLAALDRLPDRAVVHVAGRVRATGRLVTLLERKPAVCARADLRLHIYNGAALEVVHLAGCDFDLVDGAGASVPVQLASSTLLWIRGGEPMREITGSPFERALGLPILARSVRAPLEALAELRATECLFDDGAEVSVVGALSRVAAPRASLGREPAWRRTIVSPPRSPLLIRA